MKDLSMRAHLAACLFACLALFACAPPPPGPPAPPVIDLVALRSELAALPGCRVEKGEPLALSYPGEVLFADAAVLPLPGGPALLDPLAEFLLTHPELRWHGTVQAHTGFSAGYDARLARKRAGTLLRYLMQRGVPADRVTLEGQEGEGPPLRLVLQAPAQEENALSSSSEKR